MRVCAGSLGDGSYEIPHLISLLALPPQVGIRLHPSQTIQQKGRSELASYFLLETDADVFLQVESSVVFVPEEAILLCEQAEHLGLVGALSSDGQRDCSWPMPADLIEPSEGARTHVAVRWLGAGMLAIHRSVLEALAKRPDMPFLADGFYPFFYSLVKENGEQPVYLTDVHAFCERAREQGFEAFVNPGVRAMRLSQVLYQSVDVLSRGEDEATAPQGLERGVFGPRLLE